MKKLGKRLKIGIFMDSFYPAIDGVVLVVDNLCNELSKYNDVTLVVPNNSSYVDDDKRSYNVYRVNSIPIVFSEYYTGYNTSKYSKDYKELAKMNFDIIHIHSPFMIGRLGVKLAKELNIPIVATMHTRFDFEIRKIINNKFVVSAVIKKLIKVYNKCDKCIAINNAMIKVFKDYGYKGNPVVIYNGTDLKELDNREENIKKVNKLYNLKKDEILLLFVGRITEIKNIFFILDSLKLLKDENFKFKMFYVGCGPDQKKLDKKIKEYNLENEVKLLGRITDRKLLSSIYARSNLFLFPSLFDASSLVQIEAAVNETPGLFIEGSVTSDTVIDNVSGFTSKNDINNYKDRIKEIINNKKLLDEVSKNAKRMLGKNWEDIARETYELYLNMIGEYND